MNNLKIENAHIIYKNFAGNRDQYHPGKRTFSIELDEDEANALAADGWNVRRKPTKSDPDVIINTIPVELRFDIFPPKIVMIGESSKRISYLDESTVGQLDAAAIKNVDLMIRPREWSTAGKSGVKAYLKTAYITIEEDDLDLKYAALLEDAAKNDTVYPDDADTVGEEVPF
mgnify:FL=1